MLPPFKENYSALPDSKDKLRLSGTCNKHMKKYLTHGDSAGKGSFEGCSVFLSCFLILSTLGL